MRHTSPFGFCELTNSPWLYFQARIMFALLRQFTREYPPLLDPSSVLDCSMGVLVHERVRMLVSQLGEELERPYPFDCNRGGKGGGEKPRSSRAGWRVCCPQRPRTPAADIP
jgi:hypothetical protein